MHRVRATVRAVWVTLVLAMLLAGCGGSVPLLTGGSGSCLLNWFEGELVSDPAYGTAIIQRNGRPLPVRWPIGYTGRSSGLEVEVLDASGQVVVRTGSEVHLAGGYYGKDPRAWLACGDAVELL
jgi:hypothetical protein